MPVNTPQLFLSFLLIAATQNAFAQETRSVSFSPDGYRHAVVTVSRQVLTIRWEPSREEGAATIAIDTDKPVAIKVADYNFDGYQDFSISSLDEGMGTYRIYRIFTYSASREEFVEIHPACGDDFINVRLTQKSRTLINSYYSDNVMKTCTKKY